MDLEDVPDGWRIWDHEPEDRLILVFRPDVFDGSTFPPACLPTIYVREGMQDLRHAGPEPTPSSAGTYTVRLFLEPEVETDAKTHDRWSGAIEAAVALAEEFTTGEIDLRAMYHHPREPYLDRLDELTGQ